MHILSIIELVDGTLCAISAIASEILLATNSICAVKLIVLRRISGGVREEGLGRRLTALELHCAKSAPCRLAAAAPDDALGGQPDGRRWRVGVARADKAARAASADCAEYTDCADPFAGSK